jgi:hypothetical protein
VDEWDEVHPTQNQEAGMDKSVPEQRSSTQQETQLYWVILFALGSVIKRLANFMQLTEAEQEEAGIYIERVDSE